MPKRKTFFLDVAVLVSREMASSYQRNNNNSKMKRVVLSFWLSLERRVSRPLRSFRLHFSHGNCCRCRCRCLWFWFWFGWPWGRRSARFRIIGRIICQLRPHTSNLCARPQDTSASRNKKASAIVRDWSECEIQFDWSYGCKRRRERAKRGVRKRVKCRQMLSFH